MNTLTPKHKKFKLETEGNSQKIEKHHIFTMESVKMFIFTRKRLVCGTIAATYNVFNISHQLFINTYICNILHITLYDSLLASGGVLNKALACHYQPPNRYEF